MRPPIKKVTGSELLCPKRAMKLHMTEFVGKCCSVTILPSVIARDVRRDRNLRPFVREELGDALNVVTVGLEVSIAVEFGVMIFDEDGEVVGQHRILDLAAPFLQQFADEALAIAVELFFREKGPLGKASSVVLDHLHHACLSTLSVYV